MSPETEPNYNLTPSLNKNSFTYSPNKEQGKEKEIFSVNNKISNHKSTSIKQKRPSSSSSSSRSSSDSEYSSSSSSSSLYIEGEEKIKEEKGKKTDHRISAKKQIFQAMQERNLLL